LRQAYITILILMLSIFISFGLISNFINRYGLFYNLLQGAFMSLFTGGCLYLYFRFIERTNHKSISGQNLPMKAKILWRTFFWLGIVALLLGIGISEVSNQQFLFAGFAVIFLGFALMAIGVLISQGRLFQTANTP